MGLFCFDMQVGFGQCLTTPKTRLIDSQVGDKRSYDRWTVFVLFWLVFALRDLFYTQVKIVKGHVSPCLVSYSGQIIGIFERRGGRRNGVLFPKYMSSPRLAHQQQRLPVGGPIILINKIKNTYLEIVQALFAVALHYLLVVVVIVFPYSTPFVCSCEKGNLWRSKRILEVRLEHDQSLISCHVRPMYSNN